MCAPKISFPETPDPYATAGAQGAADVRTAVANAYINNIDQTTPFGKIDYTRQGYKQLTLPDGKHVKVPIFTSKQTLSSDQQKLLDTTEDVGIKLGNVALDQTKLIGKQLSNPLTTKNLPSAPSNIPKAPNLSRISSSTVPNLMTSLGYNAPIQNAIGANDFSKDRDTVTQAVLSRLNPQIDRDRAALQTRFANQGITAGSEAYNSGVDELNRQVNDLRLQAILTGGQEQSRLFGLDQAKGQFANSAQQQGYEQALGTGQFYNTYAQQDAQNRFNRETANNDIASQNWNFDLSRAQAQDTLRKSALQEDIAVRNQPINEIGALLGYGQPTVPQFTAWNPTTIASPPVASSVYNSANLDYQKALASAQLGQSSFGSALGFGGSLLGGLFSFSDRRLKENIKKVGKLNNNLPIFAYNYKGDPTPRIGPMAQDVEKVHPNAVINIGGYKAVDYSRAVQPVGA